MPRLIGATQTTAAGTQAQQITTFNSSGTFTAQPQTTNAWVLALAGGGGGGNGGGSGGGAGGHLEVPSHPLPLSPVPVTVGGGGYGGPPDPTGGFYPLTKGGKGSNTIFGSAAPLTAIGGGGGGRGVSGTPAVGEPGGSGAGGYGPANGGDATPGQGFRGGNASGGGYYAGGGGAGATGVDIGPGISTQHHGGAGGAGKASSISGSSVTRGGGGGGGSFDGGLHLGNGNPQGGLGGSGGGGNAGKVSPTFSPFPDYGNLSYWTAGGTNLGGGGGGQTQDAGGLDTASPGGSGTVIVNEPEVNYVTGTSSCWDLRIVYQKVKAGNWT